MPLPVRKKPCCQSLIWHRIPFFMATPPGCSRPVRSAMILLFFFCFLLGLPIAPQSSHTKTWSGGVWCVWKFEWTFCGYLFSAFWKAYWTEFVGGSTFHACSHQRRVIESNQLWNQEAKWLILMIYSFGIWRGSILNIYIYIYIIIHISRHMTLIVSSIYIYTTLKIFFITTKTTSYNESFRSLQAASGSCSKADGLFEYMQVHLVV